ncbi:hypothetical protein SK128_024717 [Halocaridina rubra]|uniref:Uncharacterized protein n=1 Tax=Halocaridina rubra TaxID=373956 RepID=A0AAN9AD69_HALRR
MRHNLQVIAKLSLDKCDQVRLHCLKETALPPNAPTIKCWEVSFPNRLSLERRNQQRSPRAYGGEGAIAKCVTTLRRVQQQGEVGLSLWERTEDLTKDYCKNNYGPSHKCGRRSQPENMVLPTQLPAILEGSTLD